MNSRTNIEHCQDFGRAFSGSSDVIPIYPVPTENPFNDIPNNLYANPYLLPLTVFPDVNAKTQQFRIIHRDDLEGFVNSQKRVATAPGKKKSIFQPMISGCTYGDVKTAKGSLKHDDNIETICCFIADVDNGLTLDEAVAICKKHNIAATIITSATHKIDDAKGNPDKYRIIFPLKEVF